MEKKFALDKINYILVAIGLVIIVLGFVLMAGHGSTTDAFEPDIFSVRRIKVAPIVCLVGFVFMIFAIMYRPRKGSIKAESTQEQSL